MSKNQMDFRQVNENGAETNTKLIYLYLIISQVQQGQILNTKQICKSTPMISDCTSHLVHSFCKYLHLTNIRHNRLIMNNN